MEAYLDNSATTRCLPEVAALMTRIMCEEYGNPSSMHKKGVEGERHVRHAREVISKCLKVQEKEIFFTSGGTESNNIALLGGAHANCRAGRHIITTMIEHPAVLQPCAHLESQGFEVTYLPVDEKGVIRLADLECSMTKNTILVSIMHTNNEIGSVQPVEQAGALIKRMNPGALFHVDAVQGFGKFRIYPKRMNIDLLTVSAHKLHGPKGVGFLYINEKAKVRPVMYGGGQQKGMRSGTENVQGIAGMARVVEEAFVDFEPKIEYLYGLRGRFIEGVSVLSGIRINGPDGYDAAPHIVSVSVQGVRSEVLLHALEDKGVYVSAGSACSSNKPSASATLKAISNAGGKASGKAIGNAIGVEKHLLDSTLRFSFSVYTTQEEIDYAVQCMAELVPMLRRYTIF